MRAAVYHGKEDIRLEDVPQPTITSGEVLLKVEGCTVCGVDLRTYRHGDKKITPPRIIGHEFCGTVVESAANGAGPQVGERVVMYIVLACGTCRYCQAGRTNLCTNRTTMAYHHDGAFADYVKIPARAVAEGHLYRVPDHVSSVDASLAEPLGCVLNAHTRLNIDLRDTVVVIGGGPIGIMHALVARIQGAQRVILLELSPQRLQLAEQFGFDAYVRVDPGVGSHCAEVARLTDGLGPSVVIVAVGSPQAQADALEIAGRGARVEFFGGLPKSKPEALLNTNHLHYKELLVTGSYSEKRSDFEAAQGIIASGQFPAGAVITHRLALEDMTQAFPMMETGSALKVCIQP